LGGLGLFGKEEKPALPVYYWVLLGYFMRLTGFNGKTGLFLSIFQSRLLHFLPNYEGGPFQECLKSSSEWIPVPVLPINSPLPS